MKKTILTLTLLALGVSTIFAQYKPEEGKYGITFGITGLQTVNLTPLNSGTVGFLYSMPNNIWARVNINVSSGSNTNESTLHGFKTTVKNSGMNFGLSLGAQKNFEGTDRLIPYFGADLSIGNVGGGKTINRSEVVNADSTDIPGVKNGDYNQTTTKNAKGISFGLTPVVGFHYFFVQNFAVGGEFGWGFYMSSSKGGEKTVEGTGISTTTTKTDNKISSSGFGTSGNGRISVTLFF